MATRRGLTIEDRLATERLWGPRASTIGAVGATMLALSQGRLPALVFVFCGTWIVVRIVHFFVYEQSESLAAIVGWLVAAVFWLTVWPR